MTMQQPSWRKPVGAIAIVIMIALWAGAVSTAMDYVPDLPLWLTLAIYAVAGIIWIYPARTILVWMETGQIRPPNA
jgi:Protein of unknown function (DUF2842)